MSPSSHRSIHPDDADQIVRQKSELTLEISPTRKIPHIHPGSIFVLSLHRTDTFTYPQSSADDAMKGKEHAMYCRRRP